MIQRLRASSAPSASFVSVSRTRKHYLLRLLISQLCPREDSSLQREPKEVAHPSRGVPGGAKSDSGCGAPWIEKGPETGLQGSIVVSPVSAANLLARIALPLTFIWACLCTIGATVIEPDRRADSGLLCSRRDHKQGHQCQQQPAYSITLSVTALLEC